MPGDTNLTLERAATIESYFDFGRPMIIPWMRYWTAISAMRMVSWLSYSVTMLPQRVVSSEKTIRATYRLLIAQIAGTVARVCAASTVVTVASDRVTA